MALELPSLDALPEHRRLITRAVERFAADNRVAGILLGGSLATGTPDFFSDIDLYIVVEDSHYESLFAERDAIVDSIGRVLFRYLGDHMPHGDHQVIVWYEGPVHTDLIFQKRSETQPHWKWRKSAVLKDSDGSMARLKLASADLSPPAADWEQLRILNQKFWGWVAYTFGKIARGELWEAFDNLPWIRNEALLVMLAWVQQAPFEGHRRLERKLDGRLAEMFAATLCSLEPDSLYAALIAEVRIFRELRAELCRRMDQTLDEANELELMSQLETARAERLAASTKRAT
ncbi:MAG: aminoglycoside 6-adenylyltransferase [Candidatus Binataceae bacterium]